MKKTLELSLTVSRETLRALVTLLRDDNWDVMEKDLYNQLKRYENAFPPVKHRLVSDLSDHEISELKEDYDLDVEDGYALVILSEEEFLKLAKVDIVLKVET